MTADATDIPNVKRFLVELAKALKNPYGPRPYLVMDNHRAHRSERVREELGRFRACFQPAYSSPFNCQETVWSQLKREYYTRLHRRDCDFVDAAAFEAMVQQLCDDVPVNPTTILRANHAYIASYIALGDEQSSDTF